MEWLGLILSVFILAILEIILGIDNLILLAVLTDRLPPEERQRARTWGLMFAWVTRLILLASAVWLTQLTTPVFSFDDLHFSYRDLFLILGGGFLLTKATQEIHQEVLQDNQAPSNAKGKRAFFWSIVVQVGLMDIIFSLDSVMTAVGLTPHFWVMALAITAAIGVMLFAAGFVTGFIEKYPTLKMLALSFLILIGMVLVADGFAFHIPRGYVYFAMAFSLSVETLNLIRRRRKKRG